MMAPHWILLVMLVAGPNHAPALATATYDDRPACEAAGDTLVRHFPLPSAEISWGCTPSSSGQPR